MIDHVVSEPSAPPSRPAGGSLDALRGRIGAAARAQRAAALDAWLAALLPGHLPGRQPGRGRRAGPARVRAVQRPRPGAAAQRAGRDRPDRRRALVPDLGRQARPRPLGPHPPRGALGRARRRQGRARPARRPAHRRRRGAVRRADRGRRRPVAAHRGPPAAAAAGAHRGPLGRSTASWRSCSRATSRRRAAGCATSTRAARHRPRRGRRRLRPAVRAATPRLLDARDALHLAVGRRVDRLVAQERAAVAELLGLDDGDALLRRVAGDARTVAHALDDAWRAADRLRSGRRRGAPAGAPGAPPGRPRRGRAGRRGGARPYRDRPGAGPEPVAAGGRRGGHRSDCRSPAPPASGWRPSARRCPRRGRRPPGPRWSRCSAPAPAWCPPGRPATGTG